jgi:hypothetical protein
MRQGEAIDTAAWGITDWRWGYRHWLEVRQYRHSAWDTATPTLGMRHHWLEVRLYWRWYETRWGYPHCGMRHHWLEVRLYWRWHVTRWGYRHWLEVRWGYTDAGMWRGNTDTRHEASLTWGEAILTLAWDEVRLSTLTWGEAIPTLGMRRGNTDTRHEASLTWSEAILTLAWDEVRQCRHSAGGNIDMRWGETTPPGMRRGNTITWREVRQYRHSTWGEAKLNTDTDMRRGGKIPTICELFLCVSWSSVVIWVWPRTPGQAAGIFRSTLLQSELLRRCYWVLIASLPSSYVRCLSHGLHKSLQGSSISFDLTYFAIAFFKIYYS